MGLPVRLKASKIGYTEIDAIKLKEMKGHELPKIEAEFLRVYPGLMDGYEKVAQICAAKLKDLLKDGGIKAITSYRAKEPERLEGKLLTRLAKEQPFTSQEELEDSIVDLAGVRVTLYYPGDLENLKKIVAQNFEIVGEKTHPDPKEPRGEKPYKSEYKAHHFRLRLKADALEKDALARGYDKKLVEVQIATLVMHAWSEVEHDLGYKPLSGGLSEQEIDALNQLNSLALASELALKQLERGGRANTSANDAPFANQYELASFVIDRLETRLGVLPSHFFMGSAEELLFFLRLVEKDRPSAVGKYVDDVQTAGSNYMSITELVIQRIIAENATLSDELTKARQEAGYWKAEEIPPASLIKGSLPMLYWYGIDKKRYCIPTVHLYWTWFPPRGERPIIRQLPDSELVRIQIGGNVTYRPGARLIKIASSSFVYAVSHGGILRLIADARVGNMIYGEDWQQLVDTIPDAFFTNYSVGTEVRGKSDYDPVSESALASTIDQDKDLLSATGTGV